MNITSVSPEFAKDLIALINSCKGIKYNKKVKYTSRKTGQTTEFEYTTLDKIHAHIKNDNNFALLEPMGTNEAGQPAIQIILIHKSGEAITSDYYTLNLPNNGSKQDEGAVITYTKRYALGSFLGISTDIDNDANSGNGGIKITNYRTEYMRICKENGINPIEYATENGINKKTTQAQYKQICETLEKEVRQQNEPNTPNETTISINEI
mgnify:CR=1 FL=1